MTCCRWHSAAAALVIASTSFNAVTADAIVPAIPLIAKEFGSGENVSGFVDHSQKSTVAARARAEKKAVWAAVAADCHTAPVLQATEHDLDAVAPFVSELVVIGGKRTGFGK